MTGKKILDSIIKSEKNTYFVICPYHIGDFLISGGLAHAIKKPKGKSNLKIIALQYLQKINVQFQGVDGFIFISQPQMNEIINYVHASENYVTQDYIYGHYKINKQNGWVISDIDFDFVQQYKHDIYNLPLNTELKKPVFKEISKPEIDKLHTDYILDKQKTIILAPYAYSEPHFLSADFWTVLTLNLKSRGFTVYTNIGNDREQSIPETLPLKTTFSELFYISDKVNCFIGFRSGILDFLAFSQAKILSINKLDRWRNDLKLIFPDSNSQTFYYTKPILDSLNYYLQIFGKSNGLDISVSATPKHKNLNSKFCSSFNELLQNVLISI